MTLIILIIINSILLFISFWIARNTIKGTKSIFEVLENHKAEIDRINKHAEGLQLKWEWIREQYK